MSPPWKKVEEIYFAALNLEGEARAARLSDACGDDLELRSEVESLLAAADNAQGFLDRPALHLEAEILARQPARSLAGQSLNHYRILSLLGVGGMGEVYLARDTQLDRCVAIKVLNTRAVDTDGLTRLHHEARLLASLNHPNIASIYDFQQAGPVSAIVMELVEGETLSQRIQRGPLPLEAALEIAKELAVGVEAAHRKNIIHRDLKPANIKIARDGSIKVLDFGVAKIVQPTTDGSGVTTLDGLPFVGTMSYMSPEQVRGRNVDERTDVWAWGCILYEMLTGTPAFAGETVIGAVGAILSEEPDWSKLPKATPEAIRSLLFLCLQKNRDQRPRSLGDVSLKLQTAASPAGRGDSEIALPISVARGLFLLIQIGYLAMYCSVLFNVDRLGNALRTAGFEPLEVSEPFVIVTAMAGVAVRLYLLSSVALFHAAAGRQFRRLFPLLLILDAIWAAAPLLAAQGIGFGPALAAAAGLAYLPFSQRTLIGRIYGRSDNPSQYGAL